MVRCRRIGLLRLLTQVSKVRVLSPALYFIACGSSSVVEHCNSLCSLIARAVHYYVVFSLSGKAPRCECGEQGSSPGDNPRYL